MGNLSEILRQRRKELGLTLAQIADMMGVSEATVQRWESGNIKTVRHDRIVKLSEVLRVDPSILMGWKDQNEKPTETDGLSENQRALMEFARSVPDDHAAMMLRVMRSILEGGE